VEAYWLHELFKMLATPIKVRGSGGESLEGDVGNWGPHVLTKRDEWGRGKPIGDTLWSAFRPGDAKVQWRKDGEGVLIMAGGSSGGVFGGRL